MDAAVCLTGYVRTFGVPGVYRSIEAVRRSLRASLFAVVSNDDGDTFKGQPAAVNDTVLAAARAHVRILDWRVVPGGRQELGQFAKLAYCAAIIEAHERRNRVAFDWVVRLRPDGLYQPVPPGWLESLNRTTVYQSSNSGDVMWAMPRHTLATMAAISGTPASTSPEGDVCCGTLPHRYFECACEIVRTRIASATIARIGLFPSRDLGDRRDNPAEAEVGRRAAVHRTPSAPAGHGPRRHGREPASPARGRRCARLRPAGPQAVGGGVARRGCVSVSSVCVCVCVLSLSLRSVALPPWKR